MLTVENLKQHYPLPKSSGGALSKKALDGDLFSLPVACIACWRGSSERHISLIPFIPSAIHSGSSKEQG